MKLSKQELKNLQDLRKELHLLGRRSEINELSTRLQVREKMNGIEAVYQATLEVGAVAVKDGELSASMLPGSAVKPGRAVIKRTPVKASTPTKPKTDYYLLPGGAIGSKPTSSGIKDFKAIRQARILAAQTLKAARKTATEAFGKKADELWAEYASLSTYARVNFFNQHKLQMKRN